MLNSSIKFIIMPIMGEKSISPIQWPKNLVAERDMVYESLDLLYRDFNTDTFGETMGFIVSCSRHSVFKNKNVRGIYHKIDIKALPDFASAKISVTHEVLPGLDASAQIIPVNSKLKVAGFDSGCVMPVKNFGPTKTFHTDVRSRLSHHTGQITCLAANASGTKVASGCSSGEITLYQVREDDIQFLTRTPATQATFVTAMTFMKPTAAFSFCPEPDENYMQLFHDESLLIYTTEVGRVCLLDTRCRLAETIEGETMFITDPAISITSLALIKSKPGHLLFLGGSKGELFAADLRKGGEFVYQKPSSVVEEPILRMKEIVVKDNDSEKLFLAFSNSTRELQILDLDTMQPSLEWECDRPSDGNIRDLIQVRNRIVTCGENTSIGCWNWKGGSEMDLLET